MAQKNFTQRAMNVPDAALLLGLPERSVYRAIREGQLPSVRVGRRVLVPTAPLLRLLGEHESAPEATVATR